MQQTELTPDPQAIAADLAHFTARWHELPGPHWLEIRTFGESLTPLNARYRPDAEGLDEAADFCANMNKFRRNVYMVRNPILDSARLGARDVDIAGAFYLWADCDDGAAAENVKRFTDARCTVVVRTGTTPTERVHTYWELEEPETDMSTWRQVQQSIAARFGSDDKVVNPSRIMRVAGTIAWPDGGKRGKGYQPEVARLIVPLGRDAMPFDRACRIWPAAAPRSAAVGGDGFAFDASAPAAPLDRERARVQALSGEEWHHAVIRLTASYVSRGLSDPEIHALTDPLTLPGYTIEQTRREVQTAIDGARRKGWTPEPAPAPNFDFGPAAASPEAAETWRIQSAAEFVAGFVAPEWLVEGVIQRGRLYTLTAPTGHAKTATMLYVGAQISQGADVCGLDTEQGDVLFLAGENPDDVRARVIVAMDRYGIDIATSRLHFVPGTFSIRLDMERIEAAAANLPDLALIVVDTFAAYFDGDDENSNAQALDFARVVRALTALPSRPAVVMPAHPVKNAGKGSLIPKGGSSLLNEVDGNLTVWKDDAIATMHWQGKIRGPEFEPLQLEILTATHAAVHDKRGVLMPSVVAVPVPPARAREIAQDTISRDDAVLLSVAAKPLLTMSERCAELRGPFVTPAGHANKGPLSRALARLEKGKLIRRRGDREWLLTSDGDAIAERLKRGERSVPDDV